MNDIQIEFGNKKLYLNNNGEKFLRAKTDAGPQANDFEILAHYDHLGGFIQNAEGKKLENGQFWDLYENWKNESKKLIEMMDENLANINKDESSILLIMNENVYQKRAFISTLMTIAAAIIAGLFFMFSNDYIPEGWALLFSKTSGFFYILFVIGASLWLTLILSQESTRLNKQLDFFRELRKDILKNVGTAIKSEKNFNDFLRVKLEQSEKLHNKTIYGDKEYFFLIVSGVFVLASLPIIALFIMAGFY